MSELFADKFGLYTTFWVLALAPLLIAVLVVFIKAPSSTIPETS